MEELEKKKQELQEEEERKKLEAEIQRQKEEEEKRRKEEEEKARQEALKRKQEEEERKRKQEEEERKKKEAEEQAKQSSWLQGIPPDSKTYQKLQDLQKGDQEYTDPEFPPELSSITKNTSHKHYSSLFKDAPWKRVYEIVGVDKEKVQLFDEIEPNDIS